MDIISHLVKTVSPAILGDDRTPAKKNLLEQFYAIFAARLADNDTYDRFSNENIAQDDQTFYERSGLMVLSAIKSHASLQLSTMSMRQRHEV